MRRFALALLLLVAGFARAQETRQLEFKGKTEIIKVERIQRVWDDRLSLKEFPFTLQAPMGAIRPSWNVPVGVTWTRKGRLIEITAAPKGELKISADWAVLDKTTLDITEEFDTFTLLIGGEIVPPLPPTPPVPPVPPPTPAPIPVPGFRVLIVVETSDLSKLPAPQVAIVTAKPIRDYLALRCVKGPNGEPERRIWDKDVSTENVSKIWQDAMRLERKSLPWIVISNGVAGFSGPLPATVNETLDLLKTYGGV